MPADDPSIICFEVNELKDILLGWTRMGDGSSPSPEEKEA